jgi:transposase
MPKRSVRQLRAHRCVVTPKTEAQQTLSALHRVRESLIRDRTKSVNQIHSFLLEFGISLPVGQAVIERLPAVLAEHPLPSRLIAILERLHAHFKYLNGQIGEIDKEMGRQLAEDDLGQRLLAIPGVGPVTASVLASEMGDGKQYGCSRDFAASIGLVPRQYSTGGRANLLGISKRGDKNLRRLLVQCARSYMQRLERQTGRMGARPINTATLQCGRLRISQQTGSHCVGVGEPAHHVRCGFDWPAGLSGRTR